MRYIRLDLLIIISVIISFFVALIEYLIIDFFTNGKMGNIKNYIRKKIKNLHDQNERLQARFEDQEHEEKLTKLLDKFIDGDISYEQYINLATDYQFAYMFGDGWFFDELDRRESESIEEQNYYEKLSPEQIEKLRPIDIAKLTKDYIDKKGLFSEKE